MKKNEFYKKLELIENKFNLIAQIAVNNSFSNKSKKEILFAAYDAMRKTYLLKNAVEQKTSGRSIEYIPYRADDAKNDLTQYLKDIQLFNSKDITNAEHFIMTECLNIQKEAMFVPIHVVDEMSMKKFLRDNDFFETYNGIVEETFKIEKSTRLPDPPEEDVLDNRSFLQKIISFLNGRK